MVHGLKNRWVPIDSGESDQTPRVDSRFDTDRNGRLGRVRIGRQRGQGRGRVWPEIGCCLWGLALSLSLNLLALDPNLIHYGSHDQLFWNRQVFWQQNFIYLILLVFVCYITHVLGLPTAVHNYLNSFYFILFYASSFLGLRLTITGFGMSFNRRSSLCHWWSSKICWGRTFWWQFCARWVWKMWSVAYDGMI